VQFHWEAATDNTQKTIDWLLGAPLQIAGIVVGALVIRWLVHRAIARVVSRAASAAKRAEDPQRRKSARVLAGAAGLGRTVRYVNVMEVPDILDWVKPDELLLTTAYPLRDDRAGLADLVPRLADRGLAGLAVKPARYLDAVPQVMLTAADRLGFPLLELPAETVLADIINAVLGLILNAQALRLERSAAVH